MNLKGGIFLVTTIVLVMISFYGYQIFFADNIQIDKEDFVLYIPEGAKFQQVVDTLEKHEVCNDRLSFMFLSKLLGYREKIIPGRYLLTKNSSNFKLFKMLIKGRQTPLKLTFNNIRLKEDLAEKVGSKLSFGNEGMMKILNDKALAAKYGLDTANIMALFIPNTYELYWTIKPEEFVEKMNKEYQNFWNTDRKAKAKALQLTTTEISILASIVEEETKENEEKPIVAGVYYNRLQKGQRLQADPTVKFALRDFSIKRIRFGHLENNSPYNTYRKTGLPPGPICLPMISSIDAVLNLKKHDFYFFCADPKKPGYHLFTKTFEEHSKTAENYRESLDKRNIE